MVVLLNNLGAISDLEMGILVNEAMHQLAENYSVEVHRVFSGRFMTSLEMSGFSLTVLRLCSDSILGFVDMEAKTCGWSGNSFVRKISPPVTIPDPLKMEKYIRHKKLGPESDAAFRDQYLKTFFLITLPAPLKTVLCRIQDWSCISWGYTLGQKTVLTPSKYGWSNLFNGCCRKILVILCKNYFFGTSMDNLIKVPRAS